MIGGGGRRTLELAGREAEHRRTGAAHQGRARGPDQPHVRGRRGEARLGARSRRRPLPGAGAQHVPLHVAGHRHGRPAGRGGTRWWIRSARGPVSKLSADDVLDSPAPVHRHRRIADRQGPGAAGAAGHQQLPVRRHRRPGARGGTPGRHVGVASALPSGRTDGLTQGHDGRACSAWASPGAGVVGRKGMESCPGSSSRWSHCCCPCPLGPFRPSRPPPATPRQRRPRSRSRTTVPRPAVWANLLAPSHILTQKACMTCNGSYPELLPGWGRSDLDDKNSLIPVRSKNRLMSNIPPNGVTCLLEYSKVSSFITAHLFLTNKITFYQLFVNQLQSFSKSY